MTFWETIERGEYVMIALAVLFIAIIIIWWVRAASLIRQRKSYRLLMQRIRDHVTEGDLDNALQACMAKPSPGATVVKVGLQRVGKPISEVKSAMKDSAELESQKLETGLIWLRIFAVITPLLGLGGTLTGIIDRLRFLGESTLPVDSAVICGVLSPTIVTTVAGLGVGIFSLVAYACLGSTISSSKRYLDEFALQFTDLLEEPSI